MINTKTIFCLLLISVVIADFVMAQSMSMHGTETHAISAQIQSSETSYEGSGTSWLPGSSPMYAKQFLLDEWQIMLHGNLFVRYTDQDAADAGERGSSKLDAPNWLMLSGSRTMGRDSLMLRAMLSLDPVTEGKRGYPLLFQTGETAGGQRLIDRQHPHDLFGELSFAFKHSFDQNNEALLYFGLPGEPALGPTVYLHRPSASHNPDAPLGHHWQDSTHISYGVATAGYRYKQAKLEASLFNGREPDEKRFDIDRPHFNSCSGRLSFNPTRNTAYQVSYGLLKSPESLEPGVDVHRTTASLIYNRPTADDGNLSASFVWGMNKPDGHASQHSFLIEGDYTKGMYVVFSRFEVIRKSGTDLGIPGAEKKPFTVDALTAGVEKMLCRSRDLLLSVGLTGTVYRAERELRNIYGEWPFSVEAFLHLTPALMQVGGPMHGGM